MYKTLSTKAQRRYFEYLRHDGYGSFADYLGIDVPIEEYKFEQGKRLVRFKNRNVKGEFRMTKKEAKASYKEVLKRYREKFKSTHY